MMTGNGPPRSGWVMKVVVLPSLVAISTGWSIMGVSSLSFVISWVLALARIEYDCKETLDSMTKATAEALTPWRVGLDGGT